MFGSLSGIYQLLSSNDTWSFTSLSLSNCCLSAVERGVQGGHWRGLGKSRRLWEKTSSNWTGNTWLRQLMINKEDIHFSNWCNMYLRITPQACLFDWHYSEHPPYWLQPHCALSSCGLGGFCIFVRVFEYISANEKFNLYKLYNLNKHKKTHKVSFLQFMLVYVWCDNTSNIFLILPLWHLSA